jgi:hypothetical protein
MQLKSSQTGSCVCQGLASDLIPASIQIHSSEEATNSKATRYSVASTERPRRKGQYSGRSVFVILSKKMCMCMCPISNGFLDRAISLYRSKIVDNKEILPTVSNTGIYYSSDKVVTVLPSIIHFRKFHSQHQCTLQFV